jgi:hypothetical protein
MPRLCAVVLQERILLLRSVNLPSYMHGACEACGFCATRLSDFPVNEGWERLSVRLQPLMFEIVV